MFSAWTKYSDINKPTLSCMYCFATHPKSHPLRLSARFIILCRSWHITTKPKGHCGLKSIMMWLHCCFVMQPFIIAYKLQGGTQKDLFLNSPFCQGCCYYWSTLEGTLSCPKGDSGIKLPIVRILKTQSSKIHVFSLWHHWNLCQSPLSTYEIHQGSISIKGNFYFLTNHSEQNQAGGRKNNFKSLIYPKNIQTWQ